MRALVLDVSTRTGWALMEGDPSPHCMPRLVERGAVELEGRVAKDYGPYPWGYLEATGRMADQLAALVRQHRPDAVVIEETNGGKNRYSQKTLEWIHCRLLLDILLITRDDVSGWKPRVMYVSSGDWRKTLGIRLSKEDASINAKLRRAKKSGKLKEKKQELGVRGKTDIKKVAIRWANESFSLALTAGEDDDAEALALGVAFFRGCPLADGIVTRKTKKKETPT